MTARWWSLSDREKNALRANVEYWDGPFRRFHKQTYRSNVVNSLLWDTGFLSTPRHRGGTENQQILGELLVSLLLGEIEEFHEGTRFGKRVSKITVDEIRLIAQIISLVEEIALDRASYRGPGTRPTARVITENSPERLSALCAA